MVEILKHCMCGCIYEESECPNCNQVTDKDRIEELEAKLAKAVKAIEQMQTASDAMMLHIARTILAEIKGQNRD